MSFWSTVGKVAKDAAGKIKEMSHEAAELAEDYRRYDDDYLKNKMRSGRPVERMAAAKVLKERGGGDPS